MNLLPGFHKSTMLLAKKYIIAFVKYIVSDQKIPVFWSETIIFVDVSDQR